jgi:hypothetical protein
MLRKIPDYNYAANTNDRAFTKENTLLILIRICLSERSIHFQKNSDIILIGAFALFMFISCIHTNSNSVRLYSCYFIIIIVYFRIQKCNNYVPSPLSRG